MTHGFWTNVISPFCIALAMIGIFVVANELENPVGDDTTDLNLMEMVHVMEVDFDWLLTHLGLLSASRGLEAGGERRRV